MAKIGVACHSEGQAEALVLQECVRLGVSMTFLMQSINTNRSCIRVVEWGEMDELVFVWCVGWVWFSGLWFGLWFFFLMKGILLLMLFLGVVPVIHNFSY